MSKVAVVEINVRSDSDWGLLEISGLGYTAYMDHVVVESGGADIIASGGSLYFEKSAYDDSPVEVTLRYILQDPDWFMVFKVSKGDIGATSVTVDGVDACGSRRVVEYRNEGRGLWGGQNTAHYILFSWRLPKVYATVNPAAVEPKVLAFYYPWYGALEGPSGCLSHWDMVYPDGSIETSPRVPVFGAYDSRDKDVLSVQVDLAWGAGVDGFIASWWGPGSFEDESLGVLMEVAEEEKYQVAAYIETYRSGGADMDGGDVAAEIIYIVENYAGSSSYMKQDGKPVVFVYAVNAYGRLPEFWVKVRDLVESSVGAVYMVGDFADPAYLPAFDGAHIYNQLDTQIMAQYYISMEGASPSFEGDFTTIADTLRSDGSLTLTRKLVCGTVIPGYDDTRVRSPGAVVDRLGGETLRQYWRLAEGQPWILVTSWNEWHEGTELEPSRELGEEFLELLGGLSASWRDP